MNKQNLLVFVLLVSLFGLLYQCAPTSGSDDNGSGDENEVRPAGNIFLFTDQQQIYQYSVESDRFTLLNDSAWQPLDFSAAYFGEYIVASIPDSTIGLYSVVTRQWRYFTNSGLLKGPITINAYGNIIAYTVLFEQNGRINLLYPESETVYEMDKGPALWADFPLFDKGGNGLAYTQSDGFYVRKIPNGAPVKLTDSSSIAVDFSPRGQFVSAGEQIFDLTVLKYYPSTATGTIQFINESYIVFNSTTGKDLKKAKISGVFEEDVYSGQDTLLFCIAPGKDQLAFIDRAEPQIIRFYRFNPVSEITVTTLPENAGMVKKMYWRDRPSSSP